MRSIKLVKVQIIDRVLSSRFAIVEFEHIAAGLNSARVVLSLPNTETAGNKVIEPAINGGQLSHCKFVNHVQWETWPF